MGGKAKFTTNPKHHREQPESKHPIRSCDLSVLTVIIVPLIVGTANPLFLFIFYILNTFLIT